MSVQLGDGVLVWCSKCGATTSVGEEVFWVNKSGVMKMEFPHECEPEKRDYVAVLSVFDSLTECYRRAFAQLKDAMRAAANDLESGDDAPADTVRRLREALGE